jgi:hypothetical protein
MDTIKKTEETSVGVEKRWHKEKEPLYNVQFLTKLKIELPHDPLLGIYTKEISISKICLHPYVHCSIIHNSEERVNISVHQWVNR